ncbi:MAG: calcium-translocating P-type ATPase, PMCA-type [Chitinophagaceae bacterium]
MKWYRQTTDGVLQKLQTTAKGLDAAETQKRLQQYGPNELVEKKPISPVAIFLAQFKDLMIIILIIAAIISGLLGDLVDTIVIVLIVIINAIIGFVQEYQAEKSMQALKNMTTSYARLLRNGKVHEVSVQQLVPGDVVLLEAGGVVPADLRLIVTNQLKINEASLTGESVAVEKTTNAITENDISLGDQTNLAFKGTFVTYGKGKAVVVETGMKTELGKIATMLDTAEVKTPLQKRMTAFTKKLALAVLVICVIVFTMGVLRGEEPLLMLLTAISLAVAAIPEALPSVITISLAIGAKRMVRQNALVRTLPSVETLGSVTYICTDKTGTLTQNKMTVEEIGLEDRILLSSELEKDNLNDSGKELLRAMGLNNDVVPDNEENLKGDPTEIALYEMAAGTGFDKEGLENEYERVAEIPFDSDRKCMSTIHRDGDGFLLITKGAVDVLLNKAADSSQHQSLAGASEKMAANGLRVMGFAQKRLKDIPANMNADEVETDLTVLGIAGLMDPPREEAKDAVAECKTAGIHPMMITGDHPLTATNIAERLGILEEGENAVLTGKQMNAFTEQDYKTRIKDIKVFARVSPEQKLKIVRSLQDDGQFVAMTGDGVNDAPSLKSADIGVAMGITGTDVSKEASNMVLLDDNFASIVKAVKSGRRIYDNIRKFIKYTMTSNLGEIWCIFMAPFFGLPIPLLPVHILWVNLVTDGLPGLALAAEPAEKGIMQQPPRHPRESIFAKGLGRHIIWVGILIGSVTLAAQALFIDSPKWQTMAFNVLCFSQMFHVFAIRSDYRSLFAQGLLSNKPLLGAVLLTVLLQVAIVYIPYFNPIFRTVPLTAMEFLTTVVISFIVFIAVELEKWFKRKKYHNNKKQN